MWMPVLRRVGRRCWRGGLKHGAQVALMARRGAPAPSREYDGGANGFHYSPLRCEGDFLFVRLKRAHLPRSLRFAVSSISVPAFLMSSKPAAAGGRSCRRFRRRSRRWHRRRDPYRCRGCCGGLSRGRNRRRGRRVEQESGINPDSATRRLALMRWRRRRGRAGR